MRQTIIRRSSDPWARREAWRYEGVFAKKVILRNLWPGFTWGVGAFVVFCIGEKLLKKDDHSHDHDH